MSRSNPSLDYLVVMRDTGKAPKSIQHMFIKYSFIALKEKLFEKEKTLALEAHEDDWRLDIPLTVCLSYVNK